MALSALLLATARGLFGQDPSARVKPATIEGIVTKLGTAEPLADVRVTATPESGGASKSATTNAQGRFTIADLPPGGYNLDAVRILFVRARRNTAGLHLNLSADQHLRDITIQLVPTAVLTGRVYDENRQSLGDAVYRIPNLIPGAYEIFL